MVFTSFFSQWFTVFSYLTENLDDSSVQVTRTEKVTEIHHVLWELMVGDGGGGAF